MEENVNLHEHSLPFLNFVEDFLRALKPMRWAEASPDPARTAVLSADMINGFCYTGNLASPRIAAIVPAVARLFEQADAHGVQQFVMLQEWHSPHAEEFHAFAPHGIRETPEAETVPPLAALPFAGRYYVIHKNSVSPAASPALDRWLDTHPLDTAIVVGDCTDICAYLLALHLQTRANERDQKLRVIVPADCMQTYDLPVEMAKQVGAMPHDGELMHDIFLYHMALHGIEVVSALLPQ
jgi:nicotinamidase-related amidase